MPEISSPPAHRHGGAGGGLLVSWTDGDPGSACVRLHGEPSTAEPSHLALMRSELQLRASGNALNRLGLALVEALELGAAGVMGAGSPPSTGRETPSMPHSGASAFI